MYFTRLRFITHLDCLSLASLFGNSALSCIKMNVYACILLAERGVTHVLCSLALYYAFRLFVSCVVVRQLRFIVHQNECLRLHSFRTRYIHMYFTRLRFITHLDCLSLASLFGNSALSCIKMNVYACILLAERGVTHVLCSLALYYAFRLFVSCVVVRQLRFIVHQNECLRLHSFRTRCDTCTLLACALLRI